MVGLTLTLIAANASAQDLRFRDGRFLETVGAVTLQRADEASSDEAVLNMPFLPGDRVWTDETGRAEIVFADEPTGNLDSRSGAEILDFLRWAVRETGQTVVMVTHDPVAASYSDRIVFLADGRVTDEHHHPNPQSVIARIARLGN